MIRLHGIVVLTIILVIPAPLCAAADWPTYRGDAQHTGRSSATVDPLQLQHAWKSPIGYRSPVIAGDLVYAHKWRQSGPLFGEVTAFNRVTGAVQWTTGNVYHSVSPVTIANGLAVYQAEGPGTGNAVVVRDALTGAQKYTFDISYADAGTAVTVHTDSNSTTAYVSSRGTAAITLGATTASLKWLQGDGFNLYASPVVAGDAVVSGTGGNARAHNRADGTTHTFYNNGATGGSGANVSFDAAHQRIFMHSPIGGLLAFKYNSPSDITPLWNSASISADSPAIAENGNLFGVNGTGKLVELDGTTGQLLRVSAAAGFGAYEGPVLQDNFVWVSGVRNTYDRELRVVDRETFQVLRTFPAGDSPDYANYSPPVLTDGMAAIAFSSGVSEWAGFDVYLEPSHIPEPAVLTPSLLLIAALWQRRR